MLEIFTSNTNSFNFSKLEIDRKLKVYIPKNLIKGKPTNYDRFPFQCIQDTHIHKLKSFTYWNSIEMKGKVWLNLYTYTALEQQASKGKKEWQKEIWKS